MLAVCKCSWALEFKDVLPYPHQDFMSQQLEGEWKFLTGSSTARPQRPAHFLAIQGNKVVLAIRGTQTIADCLTDCLCDGEVFHDGFAHRGATEASQWLCQEYGPALKFLEDGMAKNRAEAFPNPGLTNSYDMS